MIHFTELIGGGWWAGEEGEGRGGERGEEGEGKEGRAGPFALFSEFPPRLFSVHGLCLSEVVGKH